MQRLTSRAIAEGPAVSSSIVTALGQVYCAQISANATGAKTESLTSSETNF